jgi:adenylate cyclase
MQGCRQALAAAAAMAEALAELNRLLEKDLGEGLRMGIGIHAGATVVGEMGYRNAISVTAIGDAVNTASRLEAASKEFKCQLVVSEAVAAMAGVDLSAFPRHELSVRGRMEPLIVYAIVDATAVRAALAGKTAA